MRYQHGNTVRNLLCEFQPITLNNRNRIIMCTWADVPAMGDLLRRPHPIPAVFLLELRDNGSCRAETILDKVMFSIY